MSATPSEIVARLRSKLNTGGTDASAQPPDASAAPQPDAQTPPAQAESSTPDNGDATSGESVNIQKAFAKLQEAIAALFDQSGVRRSITVPYVEGQATHDHINAVGSALSQVGGVTKNLLTSFHHSGGKGWGTGDGATVAHPAEKLRNTLVPKDSEPAKAAIAAARSLVNKIESLIPDDPSVVTAKAQLDLVGRHDGENMTLLDLGVALQNIVGPPIQTLARLHSGTKEGGHAPHLRAPKVRTKES